MRRFESSHPRENLAEIIYTYGGIMATKVLSVKERTEFGSSASRRLRGEGNIPVVVYGHRDAQHFIVDGWEFRTKFRHISESEIITLKNGDSDLQVLIKDYQADIIKNRMIHIDFYEIEKGRTLRTHVPVYLLGTPIGVREGGILEAPLHELDIECLPKDLPEKIEVNISELQDSAALHVSDIESPTGVKILTNADQVIAAVTHAKAESVESEEAADEEEAVEEE